MSSYGGPPLTPRRRERQPSGKWSPSCQSTALDNSSTEPCKLAFCAKEGKRAAAGSKNCKYQACRSCCRYQSETQQHFVCTVQNHKEPYSAPATPASIRTALHPPAPPLPPHGPPNPPTPSYSFEDDSRPQQDLPPAQRVIPSRPYGCNCGPYVVKRFTLDGQLDPNATGPYCQKQVLASPARDLRAIEVDKEKYRVQVRVWDEVQLTLVDLKYAEVEVQNGDQIGLERLYNVPRDDHPYFSIIKKRRLAEELNVKEEDAAVLCYDKFQWSEVPAVIRLPSTNRLDLSRVPDVYKPGSVLAPPPEWSRSTGLPTANSLFRPGPPL